MPDYCIFVVPQITAIQEKLRPCKTLTCLFTKVTGQKMLCIVFTCSLGIKITKNLPFTLVYLIYSFLLVHQYGGLYGTRKRSIDFISAFYYTGSAVRCSSGRTMDINVLIFVISAAIAIVVLLSVVAALNFIRKRQFSTHYSRIKGKGNEEPAFNFVVPTHVPKMVKVQGHGGDDNTDAARIEAIDANLIDPELYKDVTKESKIISTTTRGWLCFNVRYEPETQSLIVDLVRGEKIRQRKTSQSSSANPYVKVCLLPDKKKKLQTKTRQKTSNPLFNEQFIFSCPLFGLKERTLRFTVCDFDRFSRQSSVGRVLYPLLENYENVLKEGGCEEIWRQIEDCGNCEMEVC